MHQASLLAPRRAARANRPAQLFTACPYDRRSSLATHASYQNSPALSPGRVVVGVAEASLHDKSGHPECSARIGAALQGLRKHGLLDDPQVLLLDRQPPAPLDLVLPVHSEQYLNACSRYFSKLQGATMLDDSTYATPQSLPALLEAVAAACSVVDRVAAGSEASQPPTSGMVLCRPPGHHAEPTRPMGFCLLNTISVAVRHAQLRHGFQRVAIFDFDLHHGNGTQEVFYEDPSVLYISTHQQGKWPYSGKVRDTGGRAAAGATINLPLPGDAGDGAMRAAWEQVVAPAITGFQPDIIFISAGYDGHWRDPMSGLQFTSSTFHWLGAAIQQLADSLCDGRCVLVLEGGYHLEALGDSVAGTLLGMLDRDGAGAAGGLRLREEPRVKVGAVLSEARRIHGL